MLCNDVKANQVNEDSNTRWMLKLNKVELNLLTLTVTSLHGSEHDSGAIIWPLMSGRVFFLLFSMSKASTLKEVQ